MKNIKLNKPEIKIGKSNTRESRIKSCKKCEGKPTVEDFIVEGFKGKKCKECYEIIEYERK